MAEGSPERLAREKLMTAISRFLRTTVAGGAFFSDAVRRPSVRRLDLPLAEALHCLERCGVGRGSLLGNLPFWGGNSVMCSSGISLSQAHASD
jgi:hypothetical protein